MAATYVGKSGGVRAKRWLVTFSADSDTTLTIPHGFNGVPDNVYLIPTTPQCYVGQICRSPAPDATNVYLAKTNAVGSGGSIVEVIAYIPNSSL